MNTKPKRFPLAAVLLLLLALPVLAGCPKEVAGTFDVISLVIDKLELVEDLAEDEDYIPFRVGVSNVRGLVFIHKDVARTILTGTYIDADVTDEELRAAIVELTKNKTNVEILLRELWIDHAPSGFVLGQCGDIFYYPETGELKLKNFFPDVLGGGENPQLIIEPETVAPEQSQESAGGGEEEEDGGEEEPGPDESEEEPQ